MDPPVGPGSILDIWTLPVLRGARVVLCHLRAVRRCRALKTASGSIHRFEDVPKADELESHGARVVHATEPSVILDGAFYVSGEIPRVTAFETGMQGQYRLAANGVDWEPDPLIVDERYVAVSVRDKGIVILTACSHAGVVNVLKDARERFPSMSLHGVLGGFHLSGSNEKFIPDTVTALREFAIQSVIRALQIGSRSFHSD
jgi:7,8-dihydropterin-6-yl-methyl-4-(beta-D-ribofuranosyl)aminobenzene 5'-phosphate synthase